MCLGVTFHKIIPTAFVVNTMDVLNEKFRNMQFTIPLYVCLPKCMCDTSDDQKRDR